MTKINLLREILPPPVSPESSKDIDWKSIEDNIGVGLPNDYKTLIELYGAGLIGGFLKILNPNSNNDSINWKPMVHYHQAYSELKTKYPEDFPRPNFPEKDSFLAWAETLDGDSLVWIISGEPDTWRVGIHGRDQEDEEELTVYCATEFLYELISCKFKSEFLQHDFQGACFRTLT